MKEKLKVEKMLDTVFNVNEIESVISGSGEYGYSRSGVAKAICEYIKKNLEDRYR